MRPRRCWPGWPAAPDLGPGTPRSARSPGCAGTCRWRSGCSPASCAITRPGPPAGLAADLAAARDRLALMHAENLSVAAAFDLSYQDLTAGQQRLFRRLGLHPGPDIDAYAAAALDGTSLDHRPPPPGRAVRPAPDHRARPRPVPAARPAPRARPGPGRRRRPGRPRTPPPAGCWTTTCTPPLAAGQHIATWTTAAGRPLPGRPPACAPRVHARAGSRLAGGRARQPARGRRLRRRHGAAPARHADPRRDGRLPGRPGPLGPGRSPCTRPPWPPRARPATGPARPGP